MRKEKRYSSSRQSKGKFLDRLLIVLGVFMLLFIISMIVIFCFKDAVPDTLIDKVIDGATWEAGITGAITIAKYIKGKKDDNSIGDDSDSNGMEDDV